MTSERNGQLPIPGLKVPLVTHPEAARARARGDLAEAMVDKATDLALLVRDEGRESVLAFLGDLSGGEKDALLVVLAAMMPVEDMSKGDMLAWIDFDELGRPLDPDDHRMWEDCGSLTAYWRHKYHKHRAGEIEACGCAEAGRGYWQARKAAKAQDAAREEAA
jgi:hypothetical protein